MARAVRVGTGKGGGKCDDDQDDVTKERYYHWCPDDTIEIGAWLHHQVAAKGNGKFSKQRVNGNHRALDLGNVMMLKSKLPMSSQRPHPNKSYIPYCI